MSTVAEFLFERWKRQAHGMLSRLDTTLYEAALEGCIDSEGMDAVNEWRELCKQSFSELSPELQQTPD